MNTTQFDNRLFTPPYMGQVSRYESLFHAPVVPTPFAYGSSFERTHIHANELPLPAPSYASIQFELEEDASHPLLAERDAMDTLYRQSYAPESLRMIPEHVGNYGLSAHELVAYAGLDVVQDVYTQLDMRHGTQRAQLLPNASHVDAFIKEGYARQLRDAERTSSMLVREDGTRFVPVTTVERGYQLCIREDAFDAYVQNEPLPMVLAHSIEGVSYDVATQLTAQDAHAWHVQSRMLDVDCMLNEVGRSSLRHEPPGQSRLDMESFSTVTPVHDIMNTQKVLFQDAMTSYVQDNAYSLDYMRDIRVTHAYAVSVGRSGEPSLQETTQGVRAYIEDAETGKPLHGSYVPSASGALRFQPNVIPLAQYNRMLMVGGHEPVLPEQFVNHLPRYDEQGVCTQKGLPLLTESLTLQAHTIPVADTEHGVSRTAIVDASVVCPAHTFTNERTKQVTTARSVQRDEGLSR